MRILLVSDNKVFGIGGGSLEERKYYDGIKRYIDSVGGEFKVLSIDDPFEASLTGKIEKTRKEDILSRVCGHSTYMYFVWKKHKREVYRFNPDVIVLGRSRLGFIARDIKKKLPNTKIVCNMENVEYDYVDGYFSNSSSILKKLYVVWEKLCVKRDEKEAICHSDALNYLSQRDFMRTHDLYHVSIQKQEMILPICVENPIKLTLELSKQSVVFIGSLGYESNINALNTFLNKVWLPYFADKENIGLIVGGRNPSEELECKLNSIKNCTIYKNFNSLQDVVPTHSLMIAPIQKGAGMKVKVAESLSMGLMIAASDEALVGYEDALASTNGNGVIRANSPKEYKDAIESYLGMSNEALKEIEDANITTFERYYNYCRSRESIRRMLTELVKE